MCVYVWNHRDGTELLQIIRDSFGGNPINILLRMNEYFIMAECLCCEFTVDGAERVSPPALALNCQMLCIITFCWKQHP